MKINEPNVGKQIMMKPRAILVSETDRTGIITYDDADFTALIAQKLIRMPITPEVRRVHVKHPQLQAVAPVIPEVARGNISTNDEWEEF